jgi:dimethylhistidine N-methyltransferase
VRGIGSPVSRISSEVRLGLTRRDKELPSWLFYDAEGCRLYEEITRLPEYYLTRAERSIFEEHADDIVAAAARGTGEPVHMMELGAGAATKSQLLLEAVLRRQRSATFMPADISPASLKPAVERMKRELPTARIVPVVGPHEVALESVSRLRGRQLVLFIGSSIGNYTAPEALGLLTAVRRSLRSGGALLLGTDLRKAPETLIAAYDDASGVTAAFNLNILARLNRELKARFDPTRFRHVALWNSAGSRIEMHLESTVDQIVPIEALDLQIELRRGERIHTESSVKYDNAMVDTLFAGAGFTRERTFLDGEKRFAVHVARYT